MATTAIKTASRPGTKTAAKARKKATKPFAVKAFARTILYVDDFKAAVRFYKDVLGLRSAYPAEDGWAEFATGTTAFCLHAGRAPAAKTEAVFNVGFAVADFDGACAALRAKGVVVGEPHSPCSGLRIAGFKDPSGNSVYVEGK